MPAHNKLHGRFPGRRWKDWSSSPVWLDALVRSWCAQDPQLIYCQHMVGDNDYDKRVGRLRTAVGTSGMNKLLNILEARHGRSVRTNLLVHVLL